MRICHSFLPASDSLHACRMVPSACATSLPKVQFLFFVILFQDKKYCDRNIFTYIYTCNIWGGFFAGLNWCIISIKCTITISHRNDEFVLEFYYNFFAPYTNFKLSLFTCFNTRMQVSELSEFEILKWIHTWKYAQATQVIREINWKILLIYRSLYYNYKYTDMIDFMSVENIYMYM